MDTLASSPVLPPSVRAIFFDAVGTLIHPQPPAVTVYAATGRRFGSRRTPEEIAVRFEAAFRRQEESDRAAGLRTDEAHEVARWRAIVGEVLDDATDPEACFQALFAHFARPDAWCCDAEAETTLRALANRGLALGIASNFDERLRGLVAALPALRPLRHLVLSSEVGWRKPAPDFFAAAGRRVGLPPGQILLVGDDRENDYEGALAAGWAALLFDPRGREAVAPAVRLARLGDLLG
jgi:putative hydrolase of the HAD superfamily